MHNDQPPKSYNTAESNETDLRTYNRVKPYSFTRSIICSTLLNKQQVLIHTAAIFIRHINQNNVDLLNMTRLSQTEFQPKIILAVIGKNNKMKID